MPNSVIKNGTFSVLLCTGWGLSECSKRQKMRENIELENIFEALPFFFLNFRRTYILWTCQMIFHPLSEAVPDAVLQHLIFMSLIPGF